MGIKWEPNKDKELNEKYVQFYGENGINGINFLSQIGHSAYSDLIALILDVNISTYLGYMKKMCNLL